MSRSKVSILPVLLAVSSLLAAPACKGKSELQQALEERVRWTVLALDWTQNAEQDVLLSTRLSGPPNSALDHLTVRITLQDAAGAQIAEVWHVYDLAEVPRGGPKDITVRIPTGGPVEALSLDPMPHPSAEERARIEELRGIQDAG